MTKKSIRCAGNPDELENQILVLLKSKADGAGDPRPQTVYCQSATVILGKSEGSRVVSVQKFFDVVKNKTAEFRDCLSVGVAKADKLIGKATVDEISDKKTSYRLTISLNK